MHRLLCLHRISTLSSDSDIVHVRSIIIIIGLLHFVFSMQTDEQRIENADWLQLDEDEEVEAWSHPSIYPYISVYLMGIGLMLAGFFLPFMIEVGGWLPLVLVPVGGFILALEYMRYVSVFYIFTNKRVVRKYGLIRHKTRDIGYNNIEKVNKDVSLVGRVLGFGTIIIETASREGADLTMEYVPEVYEAYSVIDQH